MRAYLHKVYIFRAYYAICIYDFSYAIHFLVHNQVIIHCLLMHYHNITENKKRKKENDRLDQITK